VVPFFGDQPFWGNVVYKAGAGPKPISSKELTSEILASAISEALQPQMRENAMRLRTQIHNENGTQNAVDAFHDNLPLHHMRCSVAPDRAAVWQVKKRNIKLSNFAATVLRKEKMLKWDDLTLYVCENCVIPPVR
jgi:UDP-glucoronosyl and UDP-glucosyl transferase